ncbi:MAG: transglutaminase-like domain-containing protein [Patescibacteria group bacterium]|jgi:hypothetical protein
MKKIIANTILSLKEKLGQPFYLKPQTFNAEFSVKIKSLEDNNELVVVLPVPEAIGGQKIANAPEFNVPPAITGAESAYGNNYAAWKLVMKKNEEIEIKEKFTVSANPSLGIQDKEHNVDNYKKDENYKLYCRANNFIHPDGGRIKALAKKITGQEGDVIKILKAINGYVAGNLKYGRPIEGLYSDLNAIANPETDCGGFASLYTSLAIASGIPSRIVSGFWAGYENNAMHAWAESMLPDGTWLPVDPATEQLRKLGRTKKFGGFGKIGSDRMIMSKGCDLSFTIGALNFRAGILQNPLIKSNKGEKSVQSKNIFIT